MVTKSTVKQWLDAIITVAMLVLIAILAWRMFHVPGPSPAAASSPLASLPSEPVSLAGAQLRGDESAVWTLLVYEDFRCSACRMFEREAMPVLLRDYVDKGVIRLAVQNIPVVSRDEAAAIEAQMAGCAAQQGRFWEFREVMFAREAPGVVGMRDVFGQVTGLDEAAMAACAEAVEGRRTTDQVVEVARKAGLRGTPYFLLGKVGDRGLDATAVKQGIGQGSDWLRQWLDLKMQ